MRGRSKAFLKELRRKHGLGEFKKPSTRARSSTRARKSKTSRSAVKRVLDRFWF